MQANNAKCLYCERNSSEVPLIPIYYQNANFWICPQHLPILIHKPSQLAHRLPGVENLGPAEGHDHH